MVRKLCLLLVLLFSFSGLTDSDLQAMRSDVQRMRVILNQMRTNLAFVDNTQSPLKHQFELETDMWQVMLDQMDRRITAMEGSHPQK